MDGWLDGRLDMGFEMVNTDGQTAQPGPGEKPAKGTVGITASIPSERGTANGTRKGPKRCCSVQCRFEGSIHHGAEGVAGSFQPQRPTISVLC